jgi:hypothetical protein
VRRHTVIHLEINKGRSHKKDDDDSRAAGKTGKLDAHQDFATLNLTFAILVDCLVR